MIHDVKTLVIRFKNNIYHDEIPLFRGAVINAVAGQDNQLFHNHEGDSFRFQYPLIQYKRISQKAALVCVGEGTEKIGMFFTKGDFQLQIGKRSDLFEIENLTPRKTIVQAWNDPFCYYLRDWLPLNGANYQQYQVLEGVVERTQMLEKILVGNILSFCKSLGITIDRAIECKILQLGTPRKVRFKGVGMMSFDAEFRCNVSLPNYIGLGKGVSIGHGTIVMKSK